MSLKAQDVVDRWLAKHGDEEFWGRIRPSAKSYAWVVAEQRLGERKSLSLDRSLALGPHTDKQQRRRLREQVDAIIRRGDLPAPGSDAIIHLSTLAGKLEGVLSGEGFNVDGTVFTDVGNLVATKGGETLTVRLTVGRPPPGPA